MPVSSGKDDVAAMVGELAAGDHVVHFYEGDDELAAAVSPYLAAATRAGDAAVVIASGEHIRAFTAAIEASGIDVARAREEGRFVCRDAAETVASFVDEEGVDAEAFRATIGGLVQRAGREGRAVRAYGEMVAVLWEAGQVLAAIELESLWNELARELPFTLFCSYAAGSVASPEQAHQLQQVCRLHSSVLTDVPQRTNGAARPAGEIAATFAPDLKAQARARSIVASALSERGYDDALVSDATLVVSELAANAARHASSPFSVIVRDVAALGTRARTLHVAVEDARSLGRSHTERMRPRPVHGLGLVAAIATRWGVARTHGGKAVWAELHVPSAAASSHRD